MFARSTTICNNVSDNAGNIANQGASAMCCVGERVLVRMDNKCTIRDCSAVGEAKSAVVVSGSRMDISAVKFENNSSVNGDPDTTYIY